MASRLTIFIVAMFLLVVSGCRTSGSAPENPGGQSAANVTMAVTVAKVTRAPMRNQLTLLGETAALRKIEIRAPAAGRVEGLSLQAGDPVRRGQIVASIVNRETEAARAGLAIANQLEPDHAAMMNEAVRRFASQPGITVRAPENAIVAQRLVSSGQIVAELDPLTELIDPSSVYVEAGAPIDVVRLIKPGMTASVSSPLSSGVEFPARVAAVSPAFNQAGATVPIRLQFTGPRRIDQTGASVEVRITTEDVADALVVPAAALFQDDSGGFHVFVVGADGRAHRTAVTIGIHNLERVQITSGLELAQTVITSGGYALSDGLAVRAISSKSQP